MKKIFYTVSNSGTPFWKHWGVFGCLWRLLLFLVLLFALFVLLTMFHEKKPAPETPKVETPGENKSESSDSIPDIVKYSGGNDKVDDEDRYSNPDGRQDYNLPGRLDNPGPYLPDSTTNILPPIDRNKIERDKNKRSPIISDKINVILDSKADDEAFKVFSAKFKEAYPQDDYEINYYNTLTKLIQITVPSSERERVKSELPSKIPNLSFKVFDESIFGSYGVVPNDVAFTFPNLAWYMQPIQAYDAWEITKGSENITVAIVDSYFDMTHCELEQSRIVKPYSIRFRSRDVRPAQDCPTSSAAFHHGSAVAAQAVGTMNNNAGLCGIAPNCKLMPISLGHEFTSMMILEGLLYAIYQGADVVNISAGSVFNDFISSLSIDEQIAFAKKNGKDEEDVWQYVFDLADKRNVTIVWAAGNENLYSGLDTSKRGKNTVVVAAVDQSLKRAVFSNFGNFDKYDIKESTVSAPGTDILCAHPFNTFSNSSGTSYSAPIVTGAIALMKSIDPTLTNSKIIEILKTTGKPIDGHPEVGPLLQVKDALLAVNGQFSDFENLQKDHKSIIGTWQSIDILYRCDADGNITSDKVNVYFQIHDVSNGTVRLHEFSSTGKVFSAPLKVKFLKDSIVISQKEVATSPDGGPGFSMTEYIWSENSDGKLQSSHKSVNNVVRYLIKKISDNPNLDITEL